MRALIALLFLTGCSHSAAVVTNAQPLAPASGVNVNAINALGAAIVIGVTAAAATQGPGSAQPMAVPAMAADREVLEQDCTKPVDLTANLRCR